MIVNFTGGVLPYKKHRYQEGNETDCELKCSNGSVMVRKFYMWKISCGKRPKGIFFALPSFLGGT